MAFGNGVVMIPLVRESLVGGGVVTEDQLLFAFTIAQVVPGQANLYVAGIGYLVFGVAAALASIVAINLPGYLMIPLVRRFERLGDLPAARGFIRGLTSTSVGLIFASTVSMAGRALNDPFGWSLFVATVVSLQFLRWNQFLSLGLISGLGLLLLASN
jgi:chromate transport protein ChrA